MPGAYGFQHRGRRKLGADVIAQRRQVGEVGQQVHLGNHSAAGADAARGQQDGLPQLAKDTFFNLDRALMRAQHADFVSLQLRGGEALSVARVCLRS